MKLLFTLFFALVASCAYAQTDDNPYALQPKMLALGKSIKTAERFNQELAKTLEGYTLAFVDDESRPTIRYVYKTVRNETLRMDFKYAMEKTDTAANSPRKPIIVYQKISADLRTITYIYNFIFDVNMTSDRVMASATSGTPVEYNGNTYQFIFQPDDYNPGYWEMTFVK